MLLTDCKRRECLQAPRLPTATAHCALLTQDQLGAEDSAQLDIGMQMCSLSTGARIYICNACKAHSVTDIPDHMQV